MEEIIIFFDCFHLNHLLIENYLNEDKTQITADLRFANCVETHL